MDSGVSVESLFGSFVQLSQCYLKSKYLGWKSYTLKNLSELKIQKNIKAVYHHVSPSHFTVYIS